MYFLGKMHILSYVSPYMQQIFLYALVETV